MSSTALSDGAKTWIYPAVNLSEHCEGKEAKQELRNTTLPLSSIIVTAAQLRDRRGGKDSGCSIEVVTAGTGLIVAIEELNLRQGLLNKSCIDYVSVRVKS